MILHVATVMHARDAYPSRHVASWPTLRDGLVRVPHPTRRPKKRIPGWIPARLDRDRRLAQHVISISVLVLDYDSGLPIPEGRQRWDRWEHLGHTSVSHTEDHHRYRIVLPLASPCPVGLWPRLWGWAIARSGGADTRARDPARLYFLPARRPRSPYESWSHSGPWLDLDYGALPDPRERIERARTRATPAITSGARFRDPAYRREVARSAGAAISVRSSGEIAHGARCPACDRASAWWAIDAYRSTYAHCDHLDTCGWSGKIEEAR